MDSKNDAIFNALREIIEEAGFAACQMEYMSKNCDSIKLSSDDVGSSYVKLWQDYQKATLDTYVDPKMSAHPQADQNEFYKTYAANADHYREISPDTCDVLAGFVDIKVFTQLMKEVKQSLGLSDTVETVTSYTDLEDMVTALLLEDKTNKALGWRNLTKTTKNDITFNVFKRPMENSNNVLWHTDQQVRGFKIAALTRYCKKFTETVKDNKDIKAFEDLLTEEGHARCYIRFGMGFMDDRDSIFDFTYKTNEAGEFVMILKTIDDTVTYPIRKDEKGKDLVRFQMMKASIAKDTDYGYECKEFFNFNMGGNFPMRLLNMFMGDGIAKEIPQLHKDLTHHSAEIAKGN